MQGLYFRAPLPDMSEPALSEFVDIDGRNITVEVSPVRQYPDYGPDMDVVHVWALREDGQPLALRDLRPEASREAAYTLWSFLCDQLSAAATLAYEIELDEDSPEPNPRLGCWGPRPDLVNLGDDDGATALILGVAIDTRRARRPGRHRLLILATRSAVVASLRQWAALPAPAPQ
jgi:hypothetical protein